MKTDLKFISGFFKWALPPLFLFLVAFTANAYQLPDTGQTNCYDASGATANVISCAGTGQDGAYPSIL